MSVIVTGNTKKNRPTVHYMVNDNKKDGYTTNKTCVSGKN